MRFLSLDFETSGLDSRRHFPVSLAVALMDGEEVVDSREWTIKPPLYGPWHCARLLAMNRIKLARYSLDSVCEHFGLSRSSEVHGAAEDAILAEKVFARLGVPA